MKTIAATFATMFMLAAIPSQAIASDQAANFLVHLFLDACVQNTGKPDGVRAFAEQHHLSPVMQKPWLDVFVGPGDGAAWMLVARDGKFALSIRGLSHACAVWTPLAQIQDAEANFRRVVESVRQSVGAQTRVIKDDTAPSRSGQARALVLGVDTPGSKGMLLFTLLTAERPNNAFQVSMQEAVATNTPPTPP